MTAQFAESLGSLIVAVNRLGSYFYGGMLGVFALAFYFPRVGGTAAFVAVLIGEAAVLIASRYIEAFLWYNVIGALIWVVGLVGAGYLFGNLPWVQANLSKIIWALIIIPGLIAIFGAWKARRNAAADVR